MLIYHHDLLLDMSEEADLVSQTFTFSFLHMVYSLSSACKGKCYTTLFPTCVLIVTFICACGPAEPSASPAKDNYRMNRYKNKALNPEEMRRRREEEGIQLRKQKREQQV